MIKAIIFDLNGVFTVRGLPKALDAFSEKYTVNRGEIKKEYRKLALQANRGDITSDELYTGLITRFRLKTTVKEMKELQFKLYAEEKRTEMYQLAKELSEKYTICLFTNFSDAFDELNKLLRIDEVFATDKIFVSAKIKMSKPSAVGFEYIIDQLGFKPEEVVFVDDKESNFENSDQMGIHGIIFKSVEQLKRDFTKILDLENLSS